MDDHDHLSYFEAKNAPKPKVSTSARTKYSSVLKFRLKKYCGNRNF